MELLTVDLRFRQRIGTAAGTHDLRRVGFVRMLSDDHQGWGELGALGTGTVIDPDLDSVVRALQGAATPRLLAAIESRHGQLPEAWQVARLVDGHPADRMAGAAIEMALLDLECRAAGISLRDRIAAQGADQPSSVPVGGLVGIPEDNDLGAFLDDAAAVLHGGVARLRVKIAPGWDAVPLAALRSRYPDLMLLADANGSYQVGSAGVDSADRLAALADFDLICIEQPLAPGDLTALAQLGDRLGTPVGLDESLSSPARVRDALRAGAMGVACLKPARLGGLLAARRAAAQCAAAGVAAFVGGFFETGLGRSANLALAHCPGFTLPGDLTPPHRYLDHAPFAYPPVESAMIAAASGPGITGQAPVPDLADYLVERRWLIEPG